MIVGVGVGVREARAWKQSVPTQQFPSVEMSNSSFISQLTKVMFTPPPPKKKEIIELAHDSVINWYPILLSSVHAY